VINPTLIKVENLINLLMRNWKANGPRLSATSALRTTAVNIKSTNAKMIFRVQIG
jgi:hypothetical protein